MENYNKFCEEKKCPEYIKWSAEGATCESCKLVGESYNIYEYPKTCLFIDEIKKIKFTGK
jgi:hypothetical protein